MPTTPHCGTTAKRKLKIKPQTIFTPVFNDHFYGAGESTTDFSMGIVRGRIAGGVAILWHKKLDSVCDESHKA